MDSLSVSPSAHRSTEVLDLLQRSTKKSKRDGVTPENHAMLISETEVVLETPLEAMEFTAEGQDERPSEIESTKGRMVLTPPTYSEMVAGKHSETQNGLGQVEKVDIEEVEEMGNDEDDEPQCPVIKMTKEELEMIRKPWRQTLIVKVMGRSVGYAYLLRRIKVLWRPKNRIDLVAIDNEYFLVKFESKEDYEFAKYEGPWMVLDHYLIVKEWHPDFDPKTDKTEKVLVWVRFPCLPIEYYNIIFLRKVGEKIGRPIRIDQTTSQVSRGRFARMCIEIDITKPLISMFKFRKRTRFVEYEGIHLVCFHCGIYGHKNENCPRSKDKEKDGELPAPVLERNVGILEKETVGRDDTRQENLTTSRIGGNYGPWMLASRKGRKDPVRKENRENQGNFQNIKRKDMHENRNNFESVSRYGPLTVEQEDGEDVALYGLEGEELGMGLEGKLAQMNNEERTELLRGGNTGENLGPFIHNKNEKRWGPKGRRPTVQISEKQIHNDKQGTSAHKEREIIKSKKVSGGQRSQPRRAAEEEEHTVVRGGENGRIISETVVRHEVNEIGVHVSLYDQQSEHHLEMGKTPWMLISVWRNLYRVLGMSPTGLSALHFFVFLPFVFLFMGVVSVCVFSYDLLLLELSGRWW